MLRGKPLASFQRRSDFFFIRTPFGKAFQSMRVKFDFHWPLCINGCDNNNIR